MWVSSLFKRRKKAKASSDPVQGTNVQGMAIVAACWQWPIYSHTFVYQEMTGFTHMGLDLKLFHWDLGDTDKLHAAFRPLMDRRVQLEPVWENHTRDMQHFEKTKPGRLRAFLERVSAATGKPVEELEKESIVRAGLHVRPHGRTRRREVHPQLLLLRPVVHGDGRRPGCSTCHEACRATPTT